jgi:DMSO/TMAO reductase YedYZ molybdopterin-dependent catalytic subunit
MTAAADAGRPPSALHDERTAALLGMALGFAFTICFLTGLLSHWVQQPPDWFNWPSRPAGLYRVTQGLHVATGIASGPLVLAKLWSVYHHFYKWPPARDIWHGLERITLLPLVGGSLFLIFSGVANIARWYPWDFFFTTTHYWTAWITIGALVIHGALKAGSARAALRSSTPPEDGPRPPDAEDGLVSRRAFLGGVAATSGVLTIVTAGQTVPLLSPLAVLSPRRPDVGPQGLPVNKTARSARVRELAISPDYRLVVDGRVERPLSLSLAELRDMDHRAATLPIACVEGWSASARWSGVAVRDLLAMAGAAPGSDVRVESLQVGGLYRASTLSAAHADDPDTLLALELRGEELHIDHGYPVRLIGPNRPGVMQTKWVSRLVVG